MVSLAQCEIQSYVQNNAMHDTMYSSNPHLILDSVHNTPALLR